MTDKFGIGSMGLGSLPGVLDTMGMVKRAWSSFNLPSNLAPTLDVDELDRRITDLKAVEQWLTMNLGMLQSAIQGLEVQRGTLAALQAFGQAMSSPADAGAFAAQAMAAMQRAAADATQVRTDPADAAAGETATRADPADAPARGAAAGEAPGAPAGDAGSASGAGGAASAVDGASLAEEMSRAAVAAVNPTAWWNLLQSQFEQIAQAALAGRGPGGGSAPSDGQPRSTGAAPRRSSAKAASSAARGATKKTARRPRGATSTG